MKTEGNTVDSVIKYQLHRDNNGGQSDYKVQFVKVNTIDNYIITQDDYDKYKEFFDFLEVGVMFAKAELEITPDKVNMNTFYVAYNEQLEPYSIINYGFIERLGFSGLYDFIDLALIEGDLYYSDSVDSNYVCFIKADI